MSEQSKRIHKEKHNTNKNTKIQQTYIPTPI